MSFWHYITADTETNGLSPTRIFMVGVQNLLTNEYKSFVGPDQVAEALYMISTETKMVVGHNFSDYDYRVSRDLVGIEISKEKILDTLPMARDLLKELRNHKLGTLGELVDLPKLKSPLFEDYSPEMDTYCERDVRVNTKSFWYMFERWLAATSHEKFRFNQSLLLDHAEVLMSSPSREYFPDPVVL